jgi:hypothetical protein
VDGWGSPQASKLRENNMRNIKQLTRRVFEKLGYTSKRKKLPPLPAFFSVLKEHGFAPTHIFDIAANRGAWTRSAV